MARTKSFISILIVSLCKGPKQKKLRVRPGSPSGGRLNGKPIVGPFKIYDWLLGAAVAMVVYASYQTMGMTALVISIEEKLYA